MQQRKYSTRCNYLLGLYIMNILSCMCEPGELNWYSDSVRAGRSGDRILVGGEIFRTRPDRPRDPYNG